MSLDRGERQPAAAGPRGSASARRGAAAGRRVMLAPLGEADARELAAAVEAGRSELRRRFAWAAGPVDDGTAARFVARAQTGGAVWGVREARAGALAGVVSLAFDPEEGAHKAKLSLWIRPELQGRGLGTEAGRLALEAAFKTLGARKVFARIDPANRAGRKVVQKLGFRYEGCLRRDKRRGSRRVDQECWGVLRSEWI